MNILNKTFIDLKNAAKEGKFKYLITRFDRNSIKIDDLDILVMKNDFEMVISSLQKIGYRKYSHDYALGGRVPGAQINLLKQGRIKIDLHKDFTWRAHRYIDLELVWKNKTLVNEFLVFISVLFEKTYFDKEDYKHVWKYKTEIFNNRIFQDQAKKHKWYKTFTAFKKWQPEDIILPVFIPIRIVAVSFFEKFHLISFLYYIFFKIRYSLKKTLPYD